MKNILVFSGSNSSNSINQILAESVSEMVEGYSVEVIRLKDFTIPMFSEDTERDSGYPDDLKKIAKKIELSDGLIISVPEHNGALPAFFKNIIDWLSRLNRYFLENKKIFLMGTSPGRGGAASSIAQAERMFRAFKGEIVSLFSLPSFNRNFSGGITDESLDSELNSQLEKFLSSL